MLKAWVKNVYSLCVESGIQCVRSYTGVYTSTISQPSTRVKPSVFTQLPTSFTPAQYTAFYRHFNLLINRLYTISTAPIINKTN